MQVETLPYERIIFVCCNQRENNNVCCNNSGGSKIRDKLKSIVKDYSLNKKIRISKSGCMGRCDSGVNIMIFPDNVWLKSVTENDMAKIIEKYVEPSNQKQ